MYGWLMEVRVLRRIMIMIMIMIFYYSRVFYSAMYVFILVQRLLLWSCAWYLSQNPRNSRCIRYLVEHREYTVVLSPDVRIP